MRRQLTIYSAGAGSGKTYKIQEELGNLVEEGTIKPERIVAVTFTEAAAAELRERIRAKLLNLGRLEDALILDQAYISTIHGFGLRLLKEFAFDAGLSPIPRLLNSDEENTLIRLALERTNKVEEIISDLGRFGYQFQWPSTTAEESFRSRLLQVVTLLRSCDWAENDGRLEKYAASWIRQRYGETKDGEKLNARLLSAVACLLESFPKSLADEFGSNPTAESEFSRDFRNLKKAAEGGSLNSDWNLWQGLRDLRKSKRGCQLPPQYDELADSVIVAADELPSHPGPLKLEETHISNLVAAGKDVLNYYAKFKREAGLVDYGDMIAMARELLSSQPDVLDILVGRVDCLVIDEFQDTNLLQHALLWQLKEKSVPTVIVGDLKQAIMGFQGADPQLFSEIIDQNLDDVEHLPNNWRSQRDLMKFINAVGFTLFGADYPSLKPQVPQTESDPIELIEFEKRLKSDGHRVRAYSVGKRLLELMKPNVDKIGTNQNDGLRGRDIAILCRTHDQLSQYAEVLRSMGLQVRLQEDGWYTSRIVQIAYQALTFLANPSDRHAAIYLAVTELGSLNLKSALEQLISKQQIDDPVLTKLNHLTSQIHDQTIFELIARMISALNLYDLASVWPDADQARANLLRLQAEAGEFMNASREALASGGHHGSGIQSFLAWLNAKIEQGNDEQPDSRFIDEDAIELVTWHSAKGREWPVVIVGGMETRLKADLPNLILGYDMSDSISEIIENSQIEYSPEFAAPESNAHFLCDLISKLELESRRLIYVALTRAKEKLVIEWPSYSANWKSLTYWSLLASDASLSTSDGMLKIGDCSFECLISKGDSELPEDMENSLEGGGTEILTIGRRAIERRQLPEVRIPDSVTPSELADSTSVDADSDQALKTCRYHKELDVELDISGMERGTFLHRCFEVLGPSPAQARRISSITGVQIEKDDAFSIADSVRNFERWLTEQFPVTLIHREVPLLGVDHNGSIVSGTADLVLETDDGVWVIDHKSDQIDDPEAAFNRYLPQLDCYSNLLQRMGYRVLGLGINWITQGSVVLCHADQA